MCVALLDKVMLPISVWTVIALIILRTFCSALEQALDGAWKEWKDVHDKGYLEVGSLWLGLLLCYFCFYLHLL